MDCAICLNHIHRRDEAYLYPCCHFFCLKCIIEWTDRQRQHTADTECQAGHRCRFACPLCKTPYTYVVYDCIEDSCRLIPTCGQPKTMSAMPLSMQQSRRRALYAKPAQAPACQVPIARRPRLPNDKEVALFVKRELQAVLLTEDVSVIVQHVQGLLQSYAKKNPAPAVYGNQQVFIQELAGSLHLFLADHGKQFAEQLWRFLHAGLTVTAYDKLIFGDDDPVLELDERQGDLIDASSDHNYREW